MELKEAGSLYVCWIEVEAKLHFIRAHTHIHINFKKAVRSSSAVLSYAPILIFTVHFDSKSSVSIFTPDPLPLKHKTKHGERRRERNGLSLRPLVGLEGSIR